MPPPWQETATHVVIEFKKGNDGVHRKIVVTHKPEQLPPQLYGRVTPELWGVFMTEINQLALEHPYTERPKADRVASWFVGFISWVTIGFACFDPDGGDYGPWIARVQQLCAKHQAAFNHGGATLTVHRVHGNFFVSVDVNPVAVAVGAPVANPAYAGPPAYPPQAAYPPPQAAYPTAPPQSYPPPQAYGAPPPPGAEPSKVV